MSFQCVIVQIYKTNVDKSVQIYGLLCKVRVVTSEFVFATVCHTWFDKYFLPVLFVSGPGMSPTIQLSTTSTTFCCTHQISSSLLMYKKVV